MMVSLADAHTIVSFGTSALYCDIAKRRNVRESGAEGGALVD